MMVTLTLNPPFIPALFAQWPNPSSWPPSVLAAPQPPMKRKSTVLVSTGADLDQIVTYSNILWVNYNAIAGKFNKKVS